MKVLWLALSILLSLATTAYATNFDSVVTQQNDETQSSSSKLDIQGFALPEGYIIENFVYEKSFSSAQCFETSLRRRTSADSHFSSDNFNKHLGKRIEVTFSTPEKTKSTYAGIINKISYNARNGGYTVQACGDITLLSLHTANKLYTNMSRVEAIQDTLAAYDLNVKFELSEQYPKIEFLTRLGETDFNFIKHVIEEVGLFFTTKMVNGKETYVFVDNIANLGKYSKTIDFKDLNTSDDGNPLRSRPSLSIANSLQSDNYRMMDFDLLQNKVVTASANSETGNKIHEEYQLSDYPASMLEKIAKVKLAALNSDTNEIQLDSTKANVDIGDQIKIGDKNYYVVSSHLYINCTETEGCSTSNSLALVPTQTSYASQISTPVPMVPTSLIGFVSDAEKDAHGRIGFRYPWMNSQPETVMYRAPLSETAKHFEYKSGDKVILTFINGFIDRPIIVDRL